MPGKQPTQDSPSSDAPEGASFLSSLILNVTCRLDVTIDPWLNFLSWNSQLVVGASEVVGCTIERMLRVNTRHKVLNLSHYKLDTAASIHIAAGPQSTVYLLN